MPASSRRPGQRRQPTHVLELLEHRLLLALTNGGFESGLTGFTLQGPFPGAVTTVTTFQGRGAAEGSSFALLSTEIEHATSSIAQTFQAQAGDVLTGQAFFFTTDTNNSTDAGSVRILDANGNLVATVFSAKAKSGSSTFTPWTSFTYTFATAGDFTIEGSAFNGQDCSSPAYLGLDALDSASAGDINPNPTPGTITAAADSYTTIQGTPLNIAAPGVLGNDVASNGATLSAAVASGPAHGLLTLNPNGSFTYTPVSGFSGVDSFTYTAAGMDLTSATGTVTVLVTPASNPNPETITVVDDGYSTLQDMDVRGGVLGNDRSSNGESLSAALATGPTHGTLTLDSHGNFTYTPEAGFFGTDTFTYIASGRGLTPAMGTVTITVLSPNPNPPPTTTLGDGITYDLRLADGGKLTVITGPGTYAVDLWALVHDPNPPFTDDGLSFGLINIMSEQIDGGAIASGGVTSGSTAAAFTRPGESQNGAVANISDDDIGDWGTTGTVGLDFPAGTMRFISANTTDVGYRAQLAGTTVAGQSQQFDATTWEWRVARFTITVTSVALGAGETDFLPQFPNANIVGWGQLAGFFQDQPGLTDPNAIFAAVASKPLSIGAPLRFVLATTPNSTPGTITTGDDAYTTAQDTALMVAAPGVLGNDSASTSAKLSAIVETGPAHGTLALNSDGSFTYVPAAGFSGVDSFTYIASGEDLASARGMVTLTVTAASNSNLGTITGGGGTYNVGQDTPLTANVVLSATTSTGVPLSAILNTEPVHGSLVFSNSGLFTYTPDAGYSGNDTFNVTIFGEGLISKVVKVLIGIQPANPNPNPPPTDTPGDGITYDLRFADGSKSTVISAPGTYTADLWVMVHDPNPPFTDDGLSYGLANIVSQQINGGAIASGGVTTGFTTAAFTRGGESQNGAAANISNDNVADWGTTGTVSLSGLPPGTLRFISSNTTDQGYRVQLAGVPTPGQSEQFDSTTWEWRVARFTITVTSVGTPGGETDFLPQFPNNAGPIGFGFLAGYFQDEPGLTDPSATITGRTESLSIGAPLRFVFGTVPIEG